jgi:hypothetical protein
MSDPILYDYYGCTPMETPAPASCIPPDPSVSGWWYVAKDGYTGPDELHEFWNAGNGNGGWWDDFVADGMTPEEAGDMGFSILGPVPSHAEVEALRGAYACMLQSANGFSDTLNAANAEIERLKRHIAGAYRCLDLDGNTRGAMQTLKAAGAELPVPPTDLVTVRREDLDRVVQLAYDEENVSQVLIDMEDAARGAHFQHLPPPPEAGQ